MIQFVLPKTIIPRIMYLNRVQEFIGKNVIKAFTGQRRVGKSYILFQIIQHILEQDSKAQIIYINKEDLAFDTIRTATDLHEYVLSNLVERRMNYVFIDEIQDITDFEKALRSLLLIENIDLYCTGSNATMLSGELATMLSGRFVEFEIHSLSYSEFLQFHNLQNNSNTIEQYMKYGGLPYLRNIKLKDDVIFEYLKNIYSTIVYRDVIDRYGLRNGRMLERLVLFLADNVGSLFSAKKISDYLKSQNNAIAPNQIHTYVDYLANAFLIHKVGRYDIVGKRIFEVGEKYYFENMGIRNAIWGYKMQDLGKILENVVFNHLMYLGYKVKVGSLQTEEIDFICEKNNEKIYIQVALRIESDVTEQREFGNLLKIKDAYPKMVITMDTFNGNSFEGIKHMNIADFLLNF
jgi:uncharacterized protein